MSYVISLGALIMLAFVFLSPAQAWMKSLEQAPTVTAVINQARDAVSDVVQKPGRGAESFEGRVVGVADGDTITVLDAYKAQVKIRLLGIDAPEKAQPYGSKAKQKLSSLVFGQRVQCQCTGTDRYGRSLCKVIVDGVDANRSMVASGFAWHNKPFARSQASADREAYTDAHDQARAARKGLWADENPSPPWDFRRTERQARSAP
jgi:endonuclease YncB( thermonuclease family)